MAQLSSRHFFLIFRIKLLPLLEYPYVIHDHTLWESCTAIGIAGEIASDSNVENKEKGFIKRIYSIAGGGRGYGVERHIVYQVFDFIGLPFDGKDVEFILKVFTTAEIIGLTFVLVAGNVGTVVNCAHYTVGQIAGEFHDVDFTTDGPPYGVDVGTQHPKGGPQTFAFGQRSPYIDPTVFKDFFALGYDSAGCVIAITKGLFFGCDHEVAIY